MLHDVFRYPFAGVAESPAAPGPTSHKQAVRSSKGYGEAVGPGRAAACLRASRRCQCQAGDCRMVRREAQRDHPLCELVTGSWLC